MDEAVTEQLHIEVKAKVLQNVRFKFLTALKVWLDNIAPKVVPDTSTFSKPLRRNRAGYRYRCGGDSAVSQQSMRMENRAYYAVAAQELIASRHQRACQHAVERLNPNGLVEAGFGQLRQAIRIIGSWHWFS
ncbi:hypothetical protein FHX03_006342 [Rhizobium sp. BK456]|nr:hypothetical protein [Rhizobium sp. BK456]MBB3526950.1 hypothetical protein [Rhizobium sp. BK456]